MTSVTIKPSTRKGKRFVAVFSNGKTVHFGSSNHENYTIHKDDERKRLYIARHQKNEDWGNPYTPGALSRWILWENASLDDSIRGYKQRFGFS